MRDEKEEEGGKEEEEGWHVYEGRGEGRCVRGKRRTREDQTATTLVIYVPTKRRVGAIALYS